jgi:hypothetical protein
VASSPEENLRKLLADLEVSQEEVADWLHMSPRQVNRWIQKGLPPVAIPKLAMAFAMRAELLELHLRYGEPLEPEYRSRQALLGRRLVARPEKAERLQETTIITADSARLIEDLAGKSESELDAGRIQAPIAWSYLAGYFALKKKQMNLSAAPFSRTEARGSRVDSKGARPDPTVHDKSSTPSENGNGVALSPEELARIAASEQKTHERKRRRGKGE